MLKTLHKYIGRDLLRVTLLAVVAFTLVMTVFAIIEPLRKSGLAAGQVGMLFGYTLPWMVSLTLPFSALFASTIVYGRFSQDRELLACRASGISIITLLKPALMLGMAVTIITLILANFVSPRMARQAEITAMHNIKRIAYHKIKKESHVKFDKDDEIFIIHATEVDEKNDVLRGVVAGRFTTRKDPKALRKIDPKTGKKVDPKTIKKVPVIDVLVASSAVLSIKRDQKTGKFYASVAMENPVGPIRSISGVQGELKKTIVENFELKNPTKDKPAFFDWDALIAMYNDPTQHSKIKSKMEKYRKEIRHNRFLADLAKTINSGGVFKKIRSDNKVYEISAHSTILSKDTVTLLSGTTANHETRRVVLKIRSDDGSEMQYTANRGKVVAEWDRFRYNDTVIIQMSGNLRLPSRAIDSKSEAPRKTSWSTGKLLMPKDEEFEKVPMVNLLEKPQDYTSDRKILASIASLKKKTPAKIRGKIEAEMNARIAYGLSGVLLVAMGGALGIIFRGGQLLTAFVISVLPAVGIFLMLLMGKRMISNPESSNLVGYLAIWGGIAALLIADIVVYYRLSKQ